MFPGFVAPELPSGPTVKLSEYETIAEAEFASRPMPLT
jgi:hypothetical protein